VRQGVTSWAVFYLLAAKGAADAGQAALTVSGLELGGLAGSYAAGLLSDAAIKGAQPGQGHVGARIKVGRGRGRAEPSRAAPLQPLRPLRCHRQPHPARGARPCPCPRW
jgi:hypothetical protein